MEKLEEKRDCTVVAEETMHTSPNLFDASPEGPVMFEAFSASIPSVLPSENTSTCTPQTPP